MQKEVLELLDGFSDYEVVCAVHFYANRKWEQAEKACSSFYTEEEHKQRAHAFDLLRKATRVMKVVDSAYRPAACEGRA